MYINAALTFHNPLNVNLVTLAEKRCCLLSFLLSPRPSPSATVCTDDNYYQERSSCTAIPCFLGGYMKNGLLSNYRRIYI